MSDKTIEQTQKEKVIEALAELESLQWKCWAKDLLDNEPNISQERKDRWLKLIDTPYSELSEEMKEHDRLFAQQVYNKLEELIIENESK